MKSGLPAILVLLGIFSTLLEREVDGFAVERRSAAPERSSDDYPDYEGVRYDEYPVRQLQKFSLMSCMHAA